MSLAWKSCGGLAWLAVLWTRFARVYGVVDTSAGAKDPDLQVGCVTWTLEWDVERCSDAFDGKCHSRILRYCLNGFVLNRRLLRETDSTYSYVTFTVRQRQLQQYHHLARSRYPDPAHRVVSARDNPDCSRSKGRPHCV